MVAGHDAWLQGQEAAAFTAYEALTDDSPTGAVGIYNSTESTEAATRDGVLSSYPNTTYDPMSVSSIDFDALWNTALSGVQSALTTAETNYETAIDAANTAYETGMNNAWSTYDSMMVTADSNVSVRRTTGFPLQFVLASVCRRWSSCVWGGREARSYCRKLCLKKD